MIRVRLILCLCSVALLCVACGSDEQLRRQASDRYESLSAAEQQQWIDYIELERRIEEFKRTHDLPSLALFWESREKKELRRGNQAQLEGLEQRAADLLRSAEESGMSLKDVQLATGEEDPANMRARLYWFKKQRELHASRFTLLLVSALVVTLSFIGFFTLVRFRQWRWETERRRSKRIRAERKRIDSEDADTEEWLAEQRKNLDALDAFYGSRGKGKSKDSDDLSE